VKLERLRDLLVPVLENPDQAGEVHWTGVKVHGWLKEQLELEVGYSTTMRYLHDLGYNLRVPRQDPPLSKPTRKSNWAAFSSARR
jgi:transposase